MQLFRPLEVALAIRLILEGNSLSARTIHCVLQALSDCWLLEELNLSRNDIGDELNSKVLRELVSSAPKYCLSNPSQKFGAAMFVSALTAVLNKPRMTSAGTSRVQSRVGSAVLLCVQGSSAMTTIWTTQLRGS